MSSSDERIKALEDRVAEQEENIEVLKLAVYRLMQRVSA